MARGSHGRPLRLPPTGIPPPPPSILRMVSPPSILRMVLVDGAGLSEGGMLWFSDLTAPDPYLILPMLSGASLFGMASLGDAGQQARAQLPSYTWGGPASAT